MNPNDPMDVTPEMATEMATKWLDALRRGEIKQPMGYPNEGEPSPSPTKAFLLYVNDDAEGGALGTRWFVSGMTGREVLAMLEVIKFRVLMAMHTPS